MITTLDTVTVLGSSCNDQRYHCCALYPLCGPWMHMYLKWHLPLGPIHSALEDKGPLPPNSLGQVQPIGHHVAIPAFSLACTRQRGASTANYQLEIISEQILILNLFNMLWEPFQITFAQIQDNLYIWYAQTLPLLFAGVCSVYSKWGAFCSLAWSAQSLHHLSWHKTEAKKAIPLFSLLSQPVSFGSCLFIQRQIQIIYT